MKSSSGKQDTSLRLKKELSAVKNRCIQPSSYGVNLLYFLSHFSPIVCLSACFANWA